MTGSASEADGTTGDGTGGARAPEGAHEDDDHRGIQRGIAIGMIAGAAIGLPLNFMAGAGTFEFLDHALVSQVATVGKAVGDLFLRLLQMLVVPLIMASLITGISRIGQLSDLGRLGGRTIAFYVSTSLLAIFTGLLAVNLVRPGVGSSLDLEGANEAAASLTSKLDASRGVGGILWDQVVRLIPKNPVAAAAEGDMLPLIFFSLMLGIFMKASSSANGGASSPAGQVERFFEGLFDIAMRMTVFVVKLSPYGVFAFMLYAAAGKGLDAFVALGWYMLAVVLALFVHAFLTLPLLLRVFAGRSAGEFARAMSPALMTAFGTASSNATLPLTITSAEQRAGISQRSTSFVLPLGATINMDGTALYEAVAVLFIAQVYGIDLGFGQQLVVAFTALLASVGAAGIPHAGTVMMVIVLQAVGLPIEGVGLILAVDRVLDMARTTVNVWSDSTAAAVVDRAIERGERD